MLVAVALAVAIAVPGVGRVGDGRHGNGGSRDGLKMVLVVVMEIEE